VNTKAKVESVTPAKRVLPLFIFFLFFIQIKAQDDEVIRVNTDLITIPVAVTDNKSRRVSGLTQDDFSIFDNNQNMTITHFSSGADKVGFLFALDTSGSVREIISKERDAALSLFQRFNSNSQIAVLHFNDKVELRVPFTNDSSELSKAFVIPSNPNTRTAIFDAALGSLMFFSSRSNDPTERKIIILISDGLDNASRARPQNVIEEANKLGVSFYVLHLPLYFANGDKLSLRKPAKGFRDLAEKTGGIYFMLGDVQTVLSPRATYDLTKIFQTIEDDLESQYIIGYYLNETSRNTETHKLSVKLNAKEKRNYRVRLLRDTFNLKRN
jgi:Ca-activated chloride channel family protein